MKRAYKEIIAFALFICALAGFCYAAAAVLRPKDADFGADWDAFLAEEKNSADVMFFGSSLVYCDVVPAVIWRECGARAYVLAGGEQTIPQTYYYIRQALRTQSPQVIFVELSGMFFKKYTGFQEANIGYMPYSLNRLRAALETAEPSLRPLLALCPPQLLTIAKQHRRLSSLTGDDFRLAFSRSSRTAGYTFLSRTETGVRGVQTRGTVINEENYATALDYLGRIKALCLEKGVTPVFYITPSYYRYSPELIARLRADADFIDFNDDFDSLGIDIKTDFFDILHFNFRGAEKFSAKLAGLLPGLGVSPSDPERSSGVWRARLDYFNSLKG